MSFKNSWDQSRISPCCNWFSNLTKGSTGHRCCKCGKEW